MDAATAAGSAAVARADDGAAATARAIVSRGPRVPAVGRRLSAATAARTETRRDAMALAKRNT